MRLIGRPGFPQQQAGKGRRGLGWRRPCCFVAVTLCPVGPGGPGVYPPPQLFAWGISQGITVTAFPRAASPFQVVMTTLSKDFWEEAVWGMVQGRETQASSVALTPDTWLRVRAGCRARHHRDRGDGGTVYSYHLLRRFKDLPGGECWWPWDFVFRALHRHLWERVALSCQLLTETCPTKCGAVCQHLSHMKTF